jgi:hypothetical protein
MDSPRRDQGHHLADPTEERQLAKAALYMHAPVQTGVIAAAGPDNVNGPEERSIVLDESVVVHPATEAEIDEYARWLGMDPVEDAALMWIAEQGIDSKLPPGWKPCQSPGADPQVYYFNFETGESVWDHPADEYFKKLYKKEKKRAKRAARQRQEDAPPTPGSVSFGAEVNYFYSEDVDAAAAASKQQQHVSAHGGTSSTSVQLRPGALVNRHQTLDVNGSSDQQQPEPATTARLNRDQAGRMACRSSFSIETATVQRSLHLISLRRYRAQSRREGEQAQRPSKGL